MRAILTVGIASQCLDVIRNAVHEKYEVTSVETCDEALALFVSDSSFDVVVSDVDLPDQPGVNLCEAIRKRFSNNILPVVFASQKSDIDTQLACYNAGADDFLLYPFTEVEFASRLDLISRYVDRERELLTEQSQMRDTLMTALTGTSELGAIVNFLERSYGIGDYSSLVEGVFRTLNQFGLRGTICLRFLEGSDANRHLAESPGDAVPSASVQYFSSEGAVKPIVADLMDTISSKGRIFDFGTRTQFNYPHASLLIINMPVEDENKYGRYKDAIPSLLAAVNEKVISLSVENQLKNQTNRLVASFEKIKQTFSEIGLSLQQGQSEVAMITKGLMLELEAKLPNLGLEEDQEQFLVRLVESNVEAAMKSVKEHENTQESFDRIIQIFSQLIMTQQKIVEELIAKSHHDSNQSTGDSEPELF